MQTFPSFKTFLSRQHNVESLEFFDIISELNSFGIIIKNGVYIAGGAVRRTIQGKPLDSDVDLFFSTPEKRMRSITH